MPKIQNSFLKGKMNKDLDERLVPKGEYREAQNILITQSESSDVGAIENIQGNILAVPMPSITGDMETIGYCADILSKKVFWFITDFTGDSGDVRTMSRAQSTNTCQILMADLNDTSAEAKIIVQGHFLNFSKDHLITGVNLIDDLLFWTDNYNQPRKINVTKAIADNTYYTKEEQISVAKVAPFLAPILKDNEENGDNYSLQNDNTISSDYLKDRFVRFSYRYKYEDGEYTTMAPFTQIVFKPLNDGQIQNVLTTDREKTDTQDVYSKTIVDIMKNHYNRIEMRIPLPGDNYQTDPNVNWNNDLRVSKIEILIKESDQDVVKVIKEIDVNDNAAFVDLIELMDTNPNDENNVNQTSYYRHVYKFVYKSEEPYKILEDKQITRVFDQVPLRAKSQEISGNRVIYGNFTENYEIPVDDSGKTGINYVIKNIVKGSIDSLTMPQANKEIYKYNSVKQRRKYQVGVVLSDVFGRQSTVILSTGDTDTTTSPAVTTDFSSNYNSGYSWSDQNLAFGKSLSIMFTENNIVDNVYNGDITSNDYNPYGWYSYKLVVKQQEQEYYNVYTNHPADNWNNESNTHDEVLGFSWVSLYGNNINKVVRDVSEVDEIREGVAGSDVKLFPKVIKKSIPITMPDGTVTDFFSPLNNMSMQGPDQDPFDVMTVGTAREQGILTKGDRDKDRVHDFVMAKRNPLLAQVKSLGENNRVKYSLDFTVNNNNTEEKSEFQIGNGNDINPFIRVGQQITKKVLNINSKKAIALSNIGKQVIDVRVDNDEQEHFDSKTIILDGDEIDDAKGGSAMMQVGQIIEFRTGDSQGLNLSLLPFNDSADNTLTVGSAEAAFLQIAWNNSQTDDNLSGVFNISGPNIPLGTTITNVQTNSTTNITTITMSDASTAAVTSYVIVSGGAGGSNLFMDENNSDENLIKTTATVEQHGNEYVVRRPILQKVELNEDSTRTILHFDRRVFPDNIDTSENKNQCLALFDPLTIKQIETENDGALVYQKIKMSHEHDFNANDQIVIQNLEEQPIAVTTGLTVLETDPVKSNLDIFYESSTSGLIKDLHNDIELNNNELEISYYNTFILSGGGNIIPVLQNGTITDKVGQWHVEESRIKGEFNGKSVDFGVRAHLVDDEYAQRVRTNALIHSGIFNSKTKVNETNQFSIGENITRAVDIQNGSIQKLYAEDTNLIIFQENKVSRALIDKDAIFTQEGQPLTTASKVVIGQIGAFAGKYGISKNPESFAVYGARKYFSDKNRGVILRLSQDGLTPLSDSGMRSFFRDNLQNANRIYGMYDEQKNKYVISLQNKHGVASTYSPEYGTSSDSTTISKDTYSTLSFDESSGGWVSFYTYKPTFGFSLSNEFYTYNLQNLYKHYSDDVQRGMFYKSVYTDPSNVEFVFNDQPTTVKNFHTIDYEGTSGWKMASAETDMHVAYPVLSSDTSVSALSIPVNFVNKENKYYGHIRNNTTTTSINQITGIDLSGIKGYFNKVKMQYWKPSEAIASSVSKGELYAVGSETVYSSQ
mgnify:FL=1